MARNLKFQAKAVYDPTDIIFFLYNYFRFFFMLSTFKFPSRKNKYNEKTANVFLRSLHVYFDSNTLHSNTMSKTQNVRLRSLVFISSINL